MTLLFHLLFILFFIGLAGFYAGLETGGYLLNRIQLRFRARQRKDHAALRLQSVLRDAHGFIFTVLIVQNIAVYLVSRSVTQLYLQAGIGRHFGAEHTILPWNAEVAATLTLMIPLFLFAEILPKNLFRRHADFLMYRCSRLLLFPWILFRPLTLFLKLIFMRLARGRGRTEALSGFSLSLQGLHDYFSEESRRDLLSDHQRDMIKNLVSMHRVSVQQLMEPLKASPAVSEEASVQDALERMRKHDVDQVVVYRGSLRRVSGWVSLFDLMDPSLKPSDSIKPLLQKMIRIPASLSLDRAFRRLRAVPEAPALVMARASPPAGLLHLRDIAHHIVKNGTVE